MDWVMRVVDAGLCGYLDVKHSRVDINDLALMNDYLDVKAENEARFSDANKPER